MLGLAIAAFLAPIAAHAYIGTAGRYFADDYCTANEFNSMGVIGALVHRYNTWSGRFSFYLAVNIAEFGGLRIVPFLPATAAIVWLGATIWSILQFGLLARLRHPILVSVFLGSLVIFATLAGTPGIVQSLYWRTGMLTYIAPLIIGTFYTGLIAFRQRHQSSLLFPWLLLSAVITFVAGGFSETYVTMQTTILLVAVLVCLLTKSTACKRSVLPLLVAGLVGSVLAMVVMIAAPGNEARQSRFPPSPELLPLVGLSIISALYFIRQSILTSPWIVINALVFPALLAFGLQSQRFEATTIVKKLNFKLVPRFFGGYVAVGFIILVSCFAPALYGMSMYPPDRALVIPYFVFICLIVIGGYSLGFTLAGLPIINRQNRATYFAGVGIVVTIILLVFGPVRLAQETFALAPQAKTYASLWDSRDEQIKVALQQGQKDLVVPPLPYIPGDITPNPNYWVNRCVAKFYGLNSIAAP